VLHKRFNLLLIEAELTALIRSFHAYAELISANVSHVELNHPASESYICSDGHKCIAVMQQQYQFFAVFPSAVNNHSMR
jgi:hypothetical protein